MVENFSKNIKEVVIISEKSDKTTNLVIEWFDYYGIKYTRQNEDSILKLNINLSDKDCQFNSEKFDYWIRRGKPNFIPIEVRKSPFYSHYKIEEKPILESFENDLKINNNIIGSYQHELNNNKIKNLIIAKQFGLNIPETIITNDKKSLKDFYSSNKRIIFKCLFKNIQINTINEKFVGTGTVLVNEDDIKKLDDIFTPSLFQGYIDKIYEVRVFFFKNSFYSMAIFSQNDEKTKIDYRNYNREKPNRCVPYNLPVEIKEKLIKFNDKLNIDTGSIDLIVNSKDEYYFLEINPQGQFDWLSSNCNYYVEKDIAYYFKNS